jgi:tetratricopeptide (TPR) repeat protein
VAALIATAGGWAFSSALGGGWLWDDDQYVTGNGLLRTAGGLAKIWFSPPGVNYFPVTASVEWIQWQCCGSHPLGYRLTNLALHLLAALLVWRLADRLGLRQGWLAGLLFAVHPLAVESVAWISELKNVLSLPLTLLAFCAYLDFDESGGRKDYGRALGWFLAAMLSKSTVAMFPVVLLLYAGWKRRRLRWADGFAAAPFFAVAIILGAVTVWFEHTRAMGGIGSFLYEPWEGRVVGAGLALAFYLGKCLWPFGLMPIYPRWVVEPVALEQLWPWLALAAAAAWGWSRRRTWGRHALFALGAFIAMLAPVLGLVPMAYLRLSWVADHFAYAALPAVAIPAAAILALLADRLAAAAPRLRSIAPSAGAALGIILALFLACQSRSYARIFVSPKAMWSYAVRQNPEAWSAHNDLGGALFNEGAIPEAIAQYREALRLNPDSVYAHLNLGDALTRLGRLPEAIGEYEETVRLRPDWAGFRNNLADALSHAGRLAEARRQYEQALELKPDYPQAENGLGSALFRSGDVGGAMLHFDAALRLDPNYAEACNNAGTVLASLNRLPEAMAQFERAIQLKPDYTEAHYSLGNAYYQMNRLPEAIHEYERALQLQPGPAEAHDHLGLLLAAVGRTAEAAQQFEEALRLNPGDSDAQDYLARLQLLRLRK